MEEKPKIFLQYLYVASAALSSFVIPIAAIVVILVGVRYLNPYDGTDDAKNKLRSGATLVTDYGTGCQYLKGTFGGITPRLNANGEHICGIKR